MKKTIKNLLGTQTKDVRLLRDFMFAKDYDKTINGYTATKEDAIDITLKIGRKSVKTVAVLATSIGIIIGGMLGTTLE